MNNLFIIYWKSYMEEKFNLEEKYQKVLIKNTVKAEIIKVLFLNTPNIEVNIQSEKIEFQFNTHKKKKGEWELCKILTLQLEHTLFWMKMLNNCFIQYR